MMYKEIEIDFDVFKELIARRETPEMTDNDVLRHLLGLSAKSLASKTNDSEISTLGSPWVWKGVVLPHGTELRALYGGRLHPASVNEGKIVYNGKPYKTPSAAAQIITGNSVNGWRFWECKIPGQEQWVLIDKLRKG